MTRNGWIAVALAATAAVLWLMTSLKSSRPPASSAAVTVEVPAAADPLAEPAPSEPQPAPLDPAAPPAAPPPTTAAPAPGDPAAPAEPPPAAPPPTAQLPPPEKSGPVDELKARFASEPRDSSAGALEKQVESAFRSSDVPPGLFKSVLCRRTVCRVETRWTPDRAVGLMAGFTRLLMTPPGGDVERVFDSNLAVSPEGEPDASGGRFVDVYLARTSAPGAAPEPVP